MNPPRSHRHPGRWGIAVLAPPVLALAVLAPAVLADRSAAAPAPADCEPPGMGAVGREPLTILPTESVDQTTTVRLAGIDVPPDAGLEAAARSVLARTLQDGCLRLEPERAGADRYGRLLAQAWAGDVWLQAALLEAGLVRVRPTLDERARMPEMLALEQRARANGAGLWRLSAYRVRRATDPATIEDGFRIVEGRVVAAERRGDIWYLNFDREWRSDFTVTISKEALPILAAAGIEPFPLEGGTIRVRGWVRRLNGPMIEVTVPEQIERIDRSEEGALPGTE